MSTMPNDDALRLNLSFVLREPSGSRTVQRASRECRRFARQRHSLLQRFASISDSELRASLTIEPTTHEQLDLLSRVGAAITPSLGLPELLPRVLGAVSGNRVLADLVTIDGPDRTPGDGPVRLFGHPSLMTTSQLPFGQDPVFVGGLVVRPDHRGLMLIGEVFGAEDDQHSAASVLETVIRDYVDQWTPRRALWENPIETVDPSVLLRRSGFGAD